MSFTGLVSLWSDQPMVSMVVWLLIIVSSLYLARKPAHRAIRSAAAEVRSALRVAARAISGTEERLVERNREVLMASGRDEMENNIIREFHRVNASVNRDLSAFPSIHRRLTEQVELIDSDYQEAANVPPDPPGWTKAVDAVAKLRGEDSSMIGKILTDIHTTVSKSQKQAFEEYRKANAKRHELLRRMMPRWRTLNQTMKEVNQSIATLQERSSTIDEQMTRYEEILICTPKAQKALSSSSMTQFFIAGIVLMIALIGGVINFYLIAMPMSEMVGGNSQLGPFKTSDVAALVIIMLEVAMGLFLMESLRVTHMFPVIGRMDDTLRRRMLWITLTILVVLACVESSLAFMRDLLAVDREALRQSLSGTTTALPTMRWIPSVGQMVMGFVLPFALTFAAIPLESFIHAARTVMGTGLVGMLRLTATSLRLLGNGCYHFGALLAQVYDLIIFIPLRIEEAMDTRKAKADGEKALVEPERPSGNGLSL